MIASHRCTCRARGHNSYGNLGAISDGGVGANGDGHGMVTITGPDGSTTHPRTSPPSQRVSRIRKSTSTRSPEAVQLEILHRAEQLQNQGISNSAFREGEEVSHYGQYFYCLISQYVNLNYLHWLIIFMPHLIHYEHLSNISHTK